MLCHMRAPWQYKDGHFLWYETSHYKEKKSYYRYGDSYYKDKMIVEPNYLYNRNSYTSNTTFYWGGLLLIKRSLRLRPCCELRWNSKPSFDVYQRIVWHNTVSNCCEQSVTGGYHYGDGKNTLQSLIQDTVWHTSNNRLNDQHVLWRDQIPVRILVLGFATRGTFSTRNPKISHTTRNGLL